MAKKVFLILALFCAVVQGAWAQNAEVKYIERSWDGSKGSGGEGVNMGSLYVHGGKITAYTGVRGKGAGIGGGNKSSIGGEVVIYEGLIQTKSETYGAGLGGGKGGNQGGSITIYSGTVKAIGGTYAAGIGGGDEASGGKVTIYGGWVECTSSSHGAGIGGSDGGDGGQVSILGGIVTCYGGLYNSWFVAHKQPAIGGGSDGGPGELTLGNNMKVLASEVHYSDTPMFVYTNAERIAACRSNRLARISTCDHTAQNGDAPSMVITYSIDDAESHTKHCRYCNTTETTNHTFVDKICNYCGKAEDTNDDLYDVTLYRATAATADMTIRSCRAVFRLKGITAGDLPVPGQANAHRFVLNFGDDESTSIN